MKHLTCACLLLLASLSACKSAPDYGRPLPDGAPALLPLGPDDKCPDFAPQWSERADILPALDNSIAWTKKPSSKQYFPIEGVTLERLQSSLEHFRSALAESKSGRRREDRDIRT